MLESIIQNIIQSLSPEYREFIESDFVTVTAQEFGTSIGLQGRSLEVLENAIFFYLLGIFDERATISFISRNCDLSLQDTQTLWSGIQLVIPEVINYALSIQSNPKSSEPNNKLDEEISAAERDLASLQTMRTMPHDIAAIKPNADITYQSSQADLLQRAVPPSTTQTDTEMPRWETDTR